MKLLKVLLGRVVRLHEMTGPQGGTIYGAHLVGECEDRYGFLQGPRELADFDLERGITFLHGYFNGAVVDRLQVFSNGLAAEAKLDTAFCDAFVDDLLAWIKETGLIEIKDDARRFYVSTVEAQSDSLLGSSFREFSGLGQELAQTLRGYGQTTPDLEVTGLALGIGGGQQLPPFKIEVREGVPTHAGIYFCSAPLRTADQMQLLERFEALLRTTVS
jgi:hypothetical protein